MADKYFPIRTETSCQLKWNWSTLYLYGGTTASCHRTGFSSITADNFDSFHNTSKKIKERQQMLEGRWPDDSCGYCREIESTGGFSDRMLHLDIPNMSPAELEKNPIATSVTPTILEVYFNNTCNMGCLYCVPQLSSKINQENKNFGDFARDGVILKSFPIDVDHTKLVEKFWNWMQANSQNLRRLNILGGEPFYQIEFDRCLDYFENSRHPNLELSIITNLMISEDRLDGYLKRFKLLLGQRRLKHVDITCSIDCFGQEQEYVRYGLKLETWLKNFEKLLKEKWIRLNINQTISLLTIKTMPELLEHLQQWRDIRSVGHYFSEVSPQPSYLEVTILGPNVFKEDSLHIISLMPEKSKEDINAKNYMKGIFKKIENSAVNEKESQNLKIFLDEKDRRRGTNWRKIFPWLVKEIDHVV